MPCRHSRLDGLLETELELDVEIAEPEAGGAKLVLHHLSNPGPLLHQDHRLLAQVVQSDRLPREPMLRRHGEDDLVLEERFEADRAVARRSAYDPELESPLGDEVDDVHRVVDRERDRDAGVLALELAEKQRQHRRTRPGRATDLEPSAKLTVRVARDLLQQLLLESQHALGAAVEPGAGLGRFHAAPGTIDEPLAEPLLERADLQAHGGLRHAELLRRL